MLKKDFVYPEYAEQRSAGERSSGLNGVSKSLNLRLLLSTFSNLMHPWVPSSTFLIAFSILSTCFFVKLDKM